MPGLRLLLNETIFPENQTERDIIRVDILAMLLFNSKQRSLRQFQELVAAADSNLEVCFAMIFARDDG